MLPYLHLTCKQSKRPQQKQLTTKTSSKLILPNDSFAKKTPPQSESLIFGWVILGLDQFQIFGLN